MTLKLINGEEYRKYLRAGYLALVLSDSQFMKSLGAVLNVLGNQLDHLERVLLFASGYHWPITDGKNVKEKWMFYNFAELKADFMRYNLLDHSDKINHTSKPHNNIHMKVVNPIDGTPETRMVGHLFYEWANEQYARASESHIQRIARVASEN
jgi:hypothetical protein